MKNAVISSCKLAFLPLGPDLLNKLIIYRIWSRNGKPVGVDAYDGKAWVNVPTGTEAPCALSIPQSESPNMLKDLVEQLRGDDKVIVDKAHYNDMRALLGLPTLD